MIATWMIYASAVGMLFGLAALALEHGLRPTRIATRSIWIAAIGATVAVPAAVALRPPRAPRIDVVRNDVGGGEVAMPAGTITATTAAAARPRPAAGRATLRTPAISYAPPDTPALDRALLIAWLLASLAVATRWARSVLALRRTRRAWRETEVGGTRVWVSSGVGPALFGMARPQVVLPEWALRLDPRSLELMLEHEAAHQRARDPMVLGLSAVLEVLAPWNVALWWQRARLRLAIEIDCDARVVAAGGDAREYASLLVAVGERMSSFARIAPAFVEHRSLLERRIVAMGDAKRPLGAPQAAMALCAAIACVAVACATPSPAKLAGGGRMPPALLDAGPAEQQFYPRVSIVETVDSQSIAWIRAAVARSYPAVLTGDSSLLFVSIFVDARGAVVKVIGQQRPTDLKPGEHIQRQMLPYFAGAYHYGGDSVNQARPDVAAERKLASNDGSGLDDALEARRPLMGFRTVFPRAFDYDTTRAAPVYDPFLGTDPRAFRRDDDLYFGPGVIGPNLLEIHVLLFKPGRGTLADFGHHVSTGTRDRLRTIAPQDTAAYSILGADAVAAIARCRPPACRPRIFAGPGPGELTAALDSGKAGSAGQMQWYAAADDAPRPSDDWRSQGSAGWALTQETWDALSHKPLLLMDGVRSSMKAVLAAGDAVQDIKRLSPAEAMKLSRDPAAANGAILVTTKGHARR